MDRASDMRTEGISLALAIAVTLVVVVLAGGSVEIVNHTGIISGLGFHDEIARSIADTGTFAVVASLLYNVWR
jgi:hypothetical protein